MTDKTSYSNNDHLLESCAWIWIAPHSETNRFGFFAEFSGCVNCLRLACYRLISLHLSGILASHTSKFENLRLVVASVTSAQTSRPCVAHSRPKKSESM